MAQKISIILLIVFIGYRNCVLAEDYKRTVITDPSTSRRCELLSEERREKISINNAYWP